MLNLEAKTNNEKIILNYLDKNASEMLAEKINNGKKSLSQCWAYIVSEAKKMAENNCACVDDATVFGWAIHFFEEDSIQAEQHCVAHKCHTTNTKSIEPTKLAPPIEVVKPISEPSIKKQKEKNQKAESKIEDFEQISLFDI